MMQDESFHMTNEIDVKIMLLIASIEVNLIVFPSAYVRRSRGGMDKILQRFMINPASIRSELSLGCRGITKNSRFFSKIT